MSERSTACARARARVCACVRRTADAVCVAADRVMHCANCLVACAAKESGTRCASGRGACRASCLGTGLAPHVCASSGARAWCAVFVLHVRCLWWASFMHACDPKTRAATCLQHNTSAIQRPRRIRCTVHARDTKTRAQHLGLLQHRGSGNCNRRCGAHTPLEASYRLWPLVTSYRLWPLTVYEASYRL